MRITGLSAPVQNMLLAALPKVAEFAVSDPPVLQPPPPSPPAQPVSVEMLVTLAASEPAIDRRRRIAIVADRGLTALERLNEELLAGLPAVERLQEIAAWTGTVSDPEDPVMGAILKEIELRMRVELAKHDIIA
ncbi:flagellar assembly protein FliX [Sphingomonas sp. RT2P30]|uniref:flagellar assembly protein FliX n=1 Tax=Parasphingomonas halimpatiens TaxID=3096162 RepID=UPI002FCB219F